MAEKEKSLWQRLRDKASEAFEYNQKKVEQAGKKERMEEAGFGEQNYFDAAQVWRAINNSDYLLHKHHLMRNDPNFSRLTPSGQKKRVKEFMDSKESKHIKEGYYERIPTIPRALGFQDVWWANDEDEYTPSDWWMSSRDALHSHTGLYQKRDEHGNPLPMDYRAPVLKDKFRGQMGFPQDYGTKEQRERAYDEWKANQEKDQNNDPVANLRQNFNHLKDPRNRQDRRLLLESLRSYFKGKDKQVHTELMKMKPDDIAVMSQEDFTNMVEDLENARDNPDSSKGAFNQYMGSLNPMV